MKSITFDVAVVGAGPAGCHLAYRMATAGLSVALFDAKAPWEKPCGGGITHLAWSRFPILTDPSLPRNEVFTSLQISPTGRFFVIDEGHAVLMVQRKDLTVVMLQHAQRVGAVHLPYHVTKIDASACPVRITCRGSATPYRARYVVGADGVRSVVRKYTLGPLPRERTLSSICQFYEGGVDDPTLIHVTPFPGYVWAFARNQCLAVGAGAMEPGFHLKPHLAAFMKKFFPGRQPLGRVQGALLPYMKDMQGFIEPRSGKNWALIGDAAGFCDTMTGEGIVYALWSADLLADAYLKGRRWSYEFKWRQAFGWHLIFGAMMVRHMYSPPTIDRMFTALTVCPAMRRVFMDFVWHRPSYTTLFMRFLKILPQTMRQWRRFRQRGGRLAPSQLGPFQGLQSQLTMQWDG